MDIDLWRANTVAEIALLDGGDRHQVKQLYRQIKGDVKAMPADMPIRKEIIEKTKPFREEGSRDIKAALRVVYLICLDDDIRAMVREDSVRRAADPNA